MRRLLALGAALLVVLATLPPAAASAAQTVPAVLVVTAPTPNGHGVALAPGGDYGALAAASGVSLVSGASGGKEGYLQTSSAPSVASVLETAGLSPGPQGICVLGCTASENALYARTGSILAQQAQSFVLSSADALIDQSACPGGTLTEQCAIDELAQEIRSVAPAAGPGVINGLVGALSAQNAAWWDTGQVALLHLALDNAAGLVSSSSQSTVLLNTECMNDQVQVQSYQETVTTSYYTESFNGLTFSSPSASSTSAGPTTTTTYSTAQYPGVCAVTATTSGSGGYQLTGLSPIYEGTAQQYSLIDLGGPSTGGSVTFTIVGPSATWNATNPTLGADYPAWYGGSVSSVSQLPTNFYTPGVYTIYVNAQHTVTQENCYWVYIESSEEDTIQNLSFGDECSPDPGIGCAQGDYPEESTGYYPTSWGADEDCGPPYPGADQCTVNQGDTVDANNEGVGGPDYMERCTSYSQIIYTSQNEFQFDVLPYALSAQVFPASARRGDEIALTAYTSPPLPSLSVTAQVFDPAGDPIHTVAMGENPQAAYQGNADDYVLPYQGYYVIPASLPDGTYGIAITATWHTPFGDVPKTYRLAVAVRRASWQVVPVTTGTN